jgi:anti-sigma regulatory factor (Ser/Thr protein kinase)
MGQAGPAFARGVQEVPISGCARLAESPESLDNYGRSSAGAVCLARIAPFAARWPCQSFLELGALPSAVPCARLHARQVLWEWGLTAFSESTELLVSELITNAMRISRTTAQYLPVRLWVVSDRAQVVIFVWDASPLPPAPADAGGDAENGRGLLIVQAVSAQWGWDFPPGLGGKVVWAQICRE